LSGGQQILLVVDGYGNNSGIYQLEIFIGTIEPPSCPANTSYGQPPAPTPPYTELVSDLHYWSVPTVYDNLLATDIQVCGVQFYGFDLYYSNDWHECVEDPSVFEVGFYEEGTSGHPGNLIWSRLITPERVPMGLFYAQNHIELNLYRGELDTCLTINGGWVSVQGVSYGGDPQNCVFWWLSSQEGDTICWKYGNGQWYQYATSMSLCLLGSGCDYVAGDANGDSNFNGVDVSYSVNYLKGFGPLPPDSCDCPPHGVISSAADANGNCQFNGVDVTYSVNYLKGLGPAPLPCPDCPPAQMSQPAAAFQPVATPMQETRAKIKAGGAE
jgi:hypothetical protein